MVEHFFGSGIDAEHGHVEVKRRIARRIEGRFSIGESQYSVGVNPLQTCSPFSGRDPAPWLSYLVSSVVVAGVLRRSGGANR